MCLNQKFILIFLMIFISVSSFAADWPQFRGANADGIAPGTGYNFDWKNKSPKICWTTPMTDDGFAGPAVAGGTVFIIDHKSGKDIVRAFNAKTGKELWRFVYAEAGSELYGFARSTPAVNNNRVYALSRGGQIHCLNAINGKKLWSRDMVKEFGGRRPQWYYSMSPLVYGDAVILCPGGINSSVVAIHRLTGKTIWRGGGSDEPGYATPVAATINGIKQYVVFTAVSLIGVDAATGKLLWRFPWTTPLEPAVDSKIARDHFNANSAAPIIIDNSIFITTGYGHGSALIEINGDKATAKWQSKAMQSQYSSPIYKDGYVYCTSDPRAIICLDIKTGLAVWRHDGVNRGGGLVAVDGMLLVMDGVRGEVILVRMTPKDYQELGRITPLGGESRTAPIISDGYLYIRNRKSLACINLR